MENAPIEKKNFLVGDKSWGVGIQQKEIFQILVMSPSSP